MALIGNGTHDWATSISVGVGDSTFSSGRGIAAERPQAAAWSEFWSERKERSGPVRSIDAALDALEASIPGLRLTR